MSLSALAPVAVFAAFCLFVASRRRERRAPEALPVQVAWAVVFTGSLLALTAWIFSSVELFPLVFAFVFSLLVWARPHPATPTAFEKIAFSRWSPALVTLVLALAAGAIGGRWNPLPLVFALLPIVPFPLDRERLRRALLSSWSAVSLAVFLLVIDLSVTAKFDYALAIYFLVIGMLLLAPRRGRPLSSEGKDSALLLALVGFVSVLVVGFVWGSLDPVPAYHDEASYLLQAKLFTEGRWKVPSPPLPEFFEQFHVLVTPVMASKYPPGHVLLLAAGVWTGSPALIPLALTGLSGALLFDLARRLANSWVALFTWLFWIGSPLNLDYRSTYLSDVTTSALWLLGWWALLRWKESARLCHLVVLAACVAWGAVTRELTTLAFAVPAAVVVLRIARSRNLWRDLAVSTAVGILILGVIPLWNAETLGDWRTSPRGVYTRQYMPYDLPGFGPGAGRPTRRLPPDLRKLDELMERYKDTHTISRLPSILKLRSARIVEGIFGKRSELFLPFALAGLFQVCAAGALAVTSAALLLLLYLTYWHMPGWVVYYIELFPVVCFLAALGIWGLISAVARILDRTRPLSVQARRVIVSAACFPSAIALVAAAASHILEIRTEKRERLEEQTDFRSRIRRIPGTAVVFVRYGPAHDLNHSLVQNGDDPARLPVWVVYDRGDDNWRLLRAAPGRTPYLYDEKRRTLVPLQPPAVSGAVTIAARSSWPA